MRNPFVVFPSTVHLWKTLYSTQGMQKPRFEGLEEHVFQTFERMYDRFEKDRDKIPAENFCEIRYEDLVADPIAGVRRIYEELNLGGFEEVLPALEKFVADTKGYETNKYRELPSGLRQQIANRWRGYIEKYGYTKELTSTASALAQNLDRAAEKTPAS